MVFRWAFQLIWRSAGNLLPKTAVFNLQTKPAISDEQLEIAADMADDSGMMQAQLKLMMIDTCRWCNHEVMKDIIATACMTLVQLRCHCLVSRQTHCVTTSNMFCCQVTHRHAISMASGTADCTHSLNISYARASRCLLNVALDLAWVTVSGADTKDLCLGFGGKDWG